MKTKAKGSLTSSSQKSTPAEVVDALNLVFGKQTYGRAVHAKGIVLKGRFLPNPAAANLSKALHFYNEVPMTIRFSDFAGIPTISDTDNLANPRGMAFRFHLPDGSETDIVAHSFNGFPAANVDEFRQLMISIGTSGSKAAEPTPADKFLATHPIAHKFLHSQQPPPVSYATLSYFGVNSFKFINSQGKACFGRYRIEPQAGIRLLTPEQIAKAAPDYLAEEIHQRVAQAPVLFNLRVQISEPGDKIDDPSIAWPESRRTIDVGVIEITAVASDSDAAQRELLFNPAALPPGIEPADPMIQSRSDIYHVSYERRHQ